FQGTIGLHGGRAHARPYAAHEIDGLVPQLWLAAMTRTTQGAGLEIILMPAMCPKGQRAAGQAELLRRHILPYALLHGPVVEVHGMLACIALAFTPGLLGWPAALLELAATSIHGWGRFLFCCNRWRSRFRSRAVVFFPSSGAAWASCDLAKRGSFSANSRRTSAAFNSICKRKFSSSISAT